MEDQVTMPEESMTTSTDDNELSIDEVNQTEDTTETTAETAEPTTEEHAQAAPADTPFMSIKYDGETENLSQEQAVELAQKGRNYDRIKQRYDALQSRQNITDMIEQQARNAGIPTEEYVNRLSEFQKQASIQKIANEYKAKNPDADDSVVNDYANQVYENQQFQAQAQAVHMSQQNDAQLKQRVQGEITEFMTRHPEVKIDETFPDEIIENVKTAHMPLEQAYLAYQNNQLKQRIASMQTNNKNTAKAVGSVTANSGDTGKNDPFLEGLFGK